MHLRSLWDFINILDKNGLLHRIDTFVDPVLEIAEITDRISKQKYGGKALLFTNTGTDFPVVTNLLGSEARLSYALRHDNLTQIGYNFELLFNLFAKPKKKFFDKLYLALQLKRLGAFLPVLKKGKGACQEVVITNPDLSILPILQLWPKDGGRFITLPLVHTKDPVTGTRNVGMYRIQVFGPDLTAMHWHRHKTGANHFRKYKQIGKKMPVAIALGGDPVYTYVATAPLPEGIDEYLLAGYLRARPVELVKCITQDIEVPADADIVIEGYIDPEEDFILEGPFGDHTGFYSKPDYYPRFHVTAITHRKNAIYPATIVGVPPQEDAYFIKATERIFLPLVRKTMLNEVLDWNMPIAGGGHNFAIVQIKKHYPGQGKKVFNALWGAGQMMFNKIMVVLDQDIDIHNYQQVAEAVLKNVDPVRDLVFTYGPLDVLDHSGEEFTYGSKLGIDATSKLTEEVASEQVRQHYQSIDVEKLLEFEEIVRVNADLLQKNLPILIISLRKKQKVKNLIEKIRPELGLTNLKLVIFVDDLFSIDDYFLVAWYAGNNIAPERDIYILDGKIYVDATMKTKQIDNVRDDYPEIALMDGRIIKKVDQNWTKYGFTQFIPSFSLKFRRDQNEN